jgi:peptidoglycan hydrolase-like protein with peptidoglycan-binding domain
MIDDRSLQVALKARGFYSGVIDGAFGQVSQAAANAALKAEGVKADQWLLSRRRIAWEQWAMKSARIDVGVIDGLMGPATRFAYERFQDHQRDTTPAPEAVAHQRRIWPRQADMPSFYGKPGTGHVRLELPYPMRLAWDKAQVIKSINIHGKCAASAGVVFARALDHYGYERLRALGLDLFGGCYANRPMRGGTALSTHAFACALDINPEANQLRWGRDRAAMASGDCRAFVDAFEAEGWVSLGRERNFDFMHFQAARL